MPFASPARPRRASVVLLLVAALVALPACDSSDPIEDPSAVAGTYRVTQLRYAPDNTSLGVVDLRSRFEGTTTLELLSGGDYTLRYRPQDGRDQVLTGTFRVTETEVRLSGRESDAAEYRRFLLDPSFTLGRQSGALMGSLERTVNTSRYPDFYTGVGEVEGELQIRLER